MSRLAELASGEARLVLAPELGGAIAELSVAGRHVLRPWSGDEDAGPFSLACNPLVPFSNRISGGGFTFGGARFELSPNLSKEPLPIHGDGFQKSWEIAARAADSARLVLEEGRIGPFRYRAEQRFALSPGALRIDIALRNAGTRALPFGCGLHPWFPRNDATRLGFHGAGVWMEDDANLPTTHHTLDEAPRFDFRAIRPLPDGAIDNPFTGWTGHARIEQAPPFRGVRIEASPNLATAIVYSPGARAPFFCFEPVSHPVDAHNMPGLPGLQVLAPGEALSAFCTFDWSDE